MSASALRTRANKTRALWSMGPALSPKVAAHAARIADPNVRADFIAAHETAIALRRRANDLLRAARAAFLEDTDPKRRAPRE